MRAESRLTAVVVFVFVCTILQALMAPLVFAAEAERIVNGNFADGLAGWSIWTERGQMEVAVAGGELQIRGRNFNGGVYQQFETGGAGSVVDISGFWRSEPTAFHAQWAEVLIINGTGLPVGGRDVKGGDNGVVLIYKNDTWSSPAGWSGEMAQTAPVANREQFTAAGSLATIVLKSGNIDGPVTGARFDGVLARTSGPGTPSNQSPHAILDAGPTAGKAPLTVAFDAGRSFDPDGDALAFSWDFGDGQYGSGMSLSHEYKQTGIFVVLLTVTDDQDNVSTATATIAVSNNGQLIANGDFTNGLQGWSTWTERGSLKTVVSDGRLQLSGDNYNGGVFQQFDTGGPGNEIRIDGFWASDPTAAKRQWAEVLIINSSRIPVNGQDLTGDAADVELIYKNNTWISPQGWSGSMAQSSPVAQAGAFTAAGTKAAIVLKSGNIPTLNTGVGFDDIVVQGPADEPPETNQPPAAVVVADALSGPAPLTVNFYAGDSFDPDGDDLAFSWDFGDGGRGTGATITHTYALAGTYTATLLVEDPPGAGDSIELVIEVLGAGDPVGVNRVVNPGFEEGFQDGVANGWQPWILAGQGYWKQSSRLGRIGSGSYGSNGEVLHAVKRLNPKVILLEGNALGMAAELRRTFPDALMVGRLFIDHLVSQYLTDPEHYGRVLAENCINTARPEIDVWQGLNEPYVNSAADARRVARFEKAFSDRIQELGKKSVVLNLAVGNPGDMENMLLPEIVDLLSSADYAGYHTYGGIDDQLLIGPQSPWYALRWRFYARMYQERGLRMPPVLYTEVNTFYQWKEGHTRPGYDPFEPWQIRDDLIAFEVESAKDPWSVGMAIYCLGASSAEFEGRETANEPVIYEAAGDHNWNHPSDARAGLWSQQFGTVGGNYRGGVVQQVAVAPGHQYALAASMKLETRRPRSQISFQIGYDLTGQTADGRAVTIVWSSDLIAAGKKETDIWYDQTRWFTATGNSVSIWFEGAQRAGDDPFRISLDEIAVTKVEP